jgi:hypothetical protein
VFAKVCNDVNKKHAFGSVRLGEANGLKKQISVIQYRYMFDIHIGYLIYQTLCSTPSFQRQK